MISFLPYVVLTLSLLIRPVWPSTYEELVSLSKTKKVQLGVPVLCLCGVFVVLCLAQ